MSQRSVFTAAVLAVALALAVAPRAAAQQTVADVRVRIVDRETGAAIAGVAIQLGGLRAETGNGGEARLARVPLGAHTLIARRLGYAVAERDVVVRGDTLLALALDVEPIPLESIRAEKRSVTIRGVVAAADREELVADADVYASGGRRVHTNRAGRFRLDRIPADDTTGISITAFGYLPASAVVVVGRDTTLHFVLQPDPVSRAMIDAQLERLDQRVRQTSLSQTVLRRDALERRAGATAYDILRGQLGFRFARIACLFVDDRKAFLGTDELQAYGAEEIERIEILDRGTMVRVYTRRFPQRMLTGRARVAPIVLVKGMGAPICH